MSSVVVEMCRLNTSRHVRTVALVNHGRAGISRQPSKDLLHQSARFTHVAVDRQGMLEISGQAAAFCERMSSDRVEEREPFRDGALGRGVDQLVGVM